MVRERSGQDKNPTSRAKNAREMGHPVFTLSIEKSQAALPITGCAQCAQRRASMGISLRHSGHFLVVGSGGGSFREREMIAFTGTTMKKYTAAAINRNEIRALKKLPTINLLPCTSTAKAENSGLPAMAAINGVSRSFTIEVTTVPNAAPITTPTARSTTLPRRMNCLKPLSTGSLQRCGAETIYAKSRMDARAC